MRFNYYLHHYFNEARQVAAVKSWHRAVNEAPVPLSIPAFLFRSEAHLPGDPADLGWERHFPKIGIVNLPGTHETMLDPPNLKTLCNRTRVCHRYPLCKRASSGAVVSNTRRPDAYRAHSQYRTPNERYAQGHNPLLPRAGYRANNGTDWTSGSTPIVKLNRNAGHAKARLSPWAFLQISKLVLRVTDEEL